MPVTQGVLLTFPRRDAVLRSGVGMTEVGASPSVVLAPGAKHYMVNIGGTWFESDVHVDEEQSVVRARLQWTFPEAQVLWNKEACILNHDTLGFTMKHYGE